MDVCLPYDVIAKNILPRLPAKSLLRFKAVCKQWSATISDPKFGHVHLQLSKNSACSSFFVPCVKTALRRAALETRRLRELSPLQHPLKLEEDYPRSRGLERRLWCYCDGIFLISHPMYLTDYVVWNPSRRAHRELVYPYPVEDLYGSSPRIGIYYHSPTMDYKVVIVGDEHNAVFSCKNNSWSEMRTNGAISFHEILVTSDESDKVGVPYQESIYWIRLEECPNVAQIVCFDGKDETLKIACNLDYYSGYGPRLFTSRDGLFVVSAKCDKIFIRKILPEWMEHEHEAQLPFSYMLPLCFIPQNKVIFLRDDTRGISPCVIYDHSGGGGETPLILLPTFNFKGSCWDHTIFPCIETLFLL